MGEYSRARLNQSIRPSRHDENLGVYQPRLILSRNTGKIEAPNGAHFGLTPEQQLEIREAHPNRPDGGNIVSRYRCRRWCCCASPPAVLELDCLSLVLVALASRLAALGFCILAACRLPELRYRPSPASVISDRRNDPNLGRAVISSPSGSRASISAYRQEQVGKNYGGPKRTAVCIPRLLDAVRSTSW